MRRFAAAWPPFSPSLALSFGRDLETPLARPAPAETSSDWATSSGALRFLPLAFFGPLEHKDAKTCQDMPRHPDLASFASLAACFRDKIKEPMRCSELCRYARCLAAVALPERTSDPSRSSLAPQQQHDHVAGGASLSPWAR